MHGSGVQALAASVVAHAVKEMRDKAKQPAGTSHLSRDKARLRVEATAWLASSQATRWFDACGLEQEHALWKIGWAAHAKELISDETIDLTPARARVLELGLDALDPTK